jgi:hypothetical protein
VSLLAHQLVLGRCLQASNLDAALGDAGRDVVIDGDALAELRELVNDPGFGFTRHVQRSWCVGRTAAVARLTLSLLTTDERRRVVDDWVDAGGGKALDLASEAAAFLRFLASRLTDPSHALSVCRMEEAAYRASAAAATFSPPDPRLLDDPSAMLRVGTASAVVRFLAEPRRLFGAMAADEPLPPLGKEGFPHLFAPGLPALRRSATTTEASLWERLVLPASLKSLRREGCSRRLILHMLGIGAIERV